ncbi:MAG: LysM peptidoglycan-binding domain-containing protein [Caldilineales bacterium]|nr:LysM peptidoglycan-binding domain-containing protein [Caldilineales bacterium]MCX7854268.1 LysM peptidoglycan-binding domain-containing protein [Caldilineales bacterium]
MKTRRYFLLVILVLLLWPATAAADGPDVHIVRAGETLAGIAARYGTTVAELMRLNSLRNPDLIYVGQRLLIRPGTTADERVHIVRRGQTLGSIARAYGVSVDDLRAANGLRGDLIFVGQRLRIPAPGSGAPTNPAPAAPRGQKKIVVDISEQRCWRYEGDVLLNTWRCSTGRNNSTATGTFRVQSKLRKAYGSTWGIWMPYWLGIYWAGPTENGIHGLPWDAKTGARTWAGLVGTPITYGCVMLNDEAMKQLWEWADIGTLVVIRR